MLQRSRHTLLAIWDQESGLYIGPRRRLQALRFSWFDGAVLSAANKTKLQSSLYTFPISCALASPPPAVKEPFRSFLDKGAYRWTCSRSALFASGRDQAGYGTCSRPSGRNVETVTVRLGSNHRSAQNATRRSGTTLYSSNSNVELRVTRELYINVTSLRK